MVVVRLARDDVCLHRLFEAQAARDPERAALACEAERLSYRELDGRANQLAHRLRRMGIGAEMIVGLCVEPSVETIVGILGILKAGAAYLPIDAADPPARIACLLEDARAGVLLSQSGLADRVPPGPAELVMLDEVDWQGEAAGPATEACAHHLAYVAYTGGSTGLPNGVCIEHASIVAYVRGICERLRFAPGMNHAVVSSIAADLVNTTIFPALASGGCLHMISRERAGHQGLLAEYFLRERIDVLKIAPSQLAALQGARNPEHVMPLQCLILGGEAPGLDWVARLRRMAPHCEIHNHYGPTEATVGAATWRAGAELPATPSGRLPLGLPLPHARLYILDERGQPVPDGEIGELHIGGAGVARGYLNRPALTAERFVADPFAAGPGARLYRSGDLARRLPDGNLDFCGRLDDQAKRSGQRVEPGENEVCSHDGVPEAAMPTHVEPRTESEEVLAAVWSELLKVENVGVHDDFFDLGGRSLLAIQAVSRIRDLFGVDMPASVLFENGSIARLARVIVEARAAGSEVRRIERRRQEGACPLSFAQERQWILHRMAPDSPAYNIVDVIDLPGSYAAAALDQALRELMRRHEVLRAAFSLVDGRPMQTILPALVPPLREVDLGGLPPERQQLRWRALAREAGRKPFDLAQPPLLRGAIVHFSPTAHRLLFCIHRIVADDWSMELIQRELRQLYEAFGRGRASPLPELPLQYPDFAQWQRERMQAEALRKASAWWQEELADAPFALELPVDRPPPSMRSYAGACEGFALPRKLRDRAAELGKQQKATLFMVLEAGFAALLRRCTGQDDILVGTPIPGRAWSETEGLVGAFLNTVVLRSRFTRRTSFRELLQQTRQRALGAWAHADLPFERLVAAVAPRHDPGRTPQLQAMFVLHSAGGLSRLAHAGAMLELHTGTAKFDLTLFVSESGDGLDCRIEYSTDLFDAATVRRMAADYANLLEAAVAEPDVALSQLPLQASGRPQARDETPEGIEL